MDWCFILVISLISSLFPIPLVDGHIPFVDGDTRLAIHQITKELGDLPSIDPSNTIGQSSSFLTDSALTLTIPPESDTSDTSSSSAIVRHSSASPSLPTERVIGGGASIAAAAQNQYPVTDLPQPSTTTRGYSLLLLITTQSNSLQSQFIIGDRRHDVSLSQNTETSNNYAINIELPMAQPFAQMGNSRTQYPRIELSLPSSSSSSTTTGSDYLQPHFPTQNRSTSHNSTTGHGHEMMPRDQSPSSSSSSSITTNPDHFQPQFQTQNPSTSHNSMTGHGHEMMPRDQSFKLGKTLLGITFQAALALVIFRFQGSSQSSLSPSSSSSSSSSSISFDIVGAAMLFGFTSTLIGIVLHSAYPTAASIGEYIGMFSAAFGFLVMTEMFLPETFNWTVWPAGVVLFLAIFAFALAKFR